jgi:nitrate/TMAO reductase-like tetraheme cytochrome c subunit
MFTTRVVKLLVVLLIIAAPVTLSVVTAQQQQPPAAQQPGGQRQGPPPPKNLQVLSKDMPGPQVVQLMREWSAALGVECNFCHQAPFDTDTPRKHVARLMLRDYVNGMKHKDGSAVTCKDCHQGQPNLLRTQPFQHALGKAAPGLQIVAKDQVMNVMQAFTKALGVKCDYCHQEGDFAAETPRKQVARFMMTEFSAKLTKPDGSRVGCNDCHQGHALPLSHLPFPRREQRPAPSNNQGEKKPGD